MASAELSRRVEKVVGYPPLCDMGDHQRGEFHEALLEADTFEDLPGMWQAAILKAEENAPNLRIVGSELAPGSCACPRADRARRSFAWEAALGAGLWPLVLPGEHVAQTVKMRSGGRVGV
jgi:hypothetical protein